MRGFAFLRRMFMKRWLLLLLIICFGVILTMSAHATPVSFGDDANIWPEWSGNVDSKDVNGIPDLLGGVAEIDAQHRLTSLTFDYTAIDRFYSSGRSIFGEVSESLVFIHSGKEFGRIVVVVILNFDFPKEISNKQDKNRITHFSWNITTNKSSERVVPESASG